MILDMTDDRETGLAGRLDVEGEGEKGIKFKLQIFGTGWMVVPFAGIGEAGGK